GVEHPGHGLPRVLDRQGHAVETGGSLDSGEREEGRHDVDQADRRSDPAAGEPAVRELEDQRHLERLAIEQDAVLLLAVIAEPLAVIGKEHDDGPIVETQALELVEEPADDSVRRRDLAVVSVRIAGAERLGRLVRRMRLVEVKQEEERFALARLDPIESEPRGLPSRPLAAAEGLAGAQVDRRLEEVE